MIEAEFGMLSPNHLSPVGMTLLDSWANYWLRAAIFINFGHLSYDLSFSIHYIMGIVKCFAASHLVLP